MFIFRLVGLVRLDKAVKVFDFRTKTFAATNPRFNFVTLVAILFAVTHNAVVDGLTG